MLEKSRQASGISRRSAEAKERLAAGRALHGPLALPSQARQSPKTSRSLAHGRRTTHKHRARVPQRPQSTGNTNTSTNGANPQPPTMERHPHHRKTTPAAGDTATPTTLFCQVEAVETAIWLAEVANKNKEHKDFLNRLADAQAEANPLLFRIALKLATGAGKTTVMAIFGSVNP